MKERISITLDREAVDILNNLIKNRKYRNRSHAVEMAISELNKIELEKSNSSQNENN